MKKLLYTLFIIPLIALGQVPQGVNYQAVAYDANGFELANQEISIRLGILLEAADAESSYSETHQITTNNFGLFSLVISQGNSIDNFSSLNWENGAFLKVEIDENLDGEYNLMGINSFSSVPYSLFAENIPQYYSNQLSDFLSEIDSLKELVSFVSLFLGCNDDQSCNYNIEAIMIYDNCDYPDYGYDCNGNCIDTDGDEICDLDEVEGCTDESACNYIVGASDDDDGTCEYQVQYYDCIGICVNDQDADGICDELEEGCTDETAENYDLFAQIEDGTCFYNVACPYPEYFEYSTNSPNYSIEMCLTFIVEGCTDSNSVSFDQLANLEDGSCIYNGCMDTIADNFDSQANQEDETCLYYGCTNFDSDNYWSTANVDDGSCYRYGCMLDIYPNYDHIATIDDGSCSIMVEIGDTLQGGIVFYVDGTGEHGLVAATGDLGTYQWGCYGTSISGADGTSIGTGYQNTLDIISGCSETPIAASEPLAYESEGHSDWYLPSKDELYEMYSTIGQGSPEGNIGGFENNLYWSSSESGSYGALGVDFNDGGASGINKSGAGRVRVIRAF